jgi:hypothetical protein
VTGSDNKSRPAIILVGDTYSDLGATITGPQADLNLGIGTYVNGSPMNPIQLDTSTVATDTIVYVATNQNGLTSTNEKRHHPTSERQHSPTREHNDHGNEHSIVLLRTLLNTSSARNGGTVRPHSAGCRGAEFSLRVTPLPRLMINTSNMAGGMAITCNIVVAPPAGGPYENTKVQRAHHVTVRYAQVRNIFLRTRRSAIDLDEGFDLGARCSGPASSPEPMSRFGADTAAAADPTTVATIRITPMIHSTVITKTS